MNSIAKIFTNFKDFYNEINGATLTGAIDVIVVEQPDGQYQCSPFHVRFGKLGVLRSREKIVDIEVNGEPVDIHMKLGESGEAFFVEECPEDDLEILPDHMATSPIPTSEFHQYDDSNNSSNASETVATCSTKDTLQLPRPRRNSIDLSSQTTDLGEDGKSKVYENQVSDYTLRRHTDNNLTRPDLTASKLEYTTQKLRQEWEAEKEQMEQEEQQIKAAAQEIAEINNENVFRPIEKEETTPVVQVTASKSEPIEISTLVEDKQVKEDTKSKKKRRKKSVLKKKNNPPASSAQRKNSSSSGNSDQNELETENNSISITTTSSNESSMPELSMKESLKTEDNLPVENNDSVIIENEKPARHLELDIHFFSDTEAQTGPTPHRPSSPVQSDTEFEFSQRESTHDTSINSASWKWGELPNPPEGADSKHDVAESKRSMLSGMFSFMKQGRKMRKTNEGLYLEDFENEDIDPEVAALYFPEHHLRNKEKNSGKGHHEDDRESGNGTSVPQSPTSMEGIKSLDSDYDDGNKSDKYLDFVAISLCGNLEKGNPTDEEFKKHQIQFAEICQNPSIFSSPNLVVRLNGKYYNWQVACPIVMTLIIYQKPLPSDVCEQLDKLVKEQQKGVVSLDDSGTSKTELDQQQATKSSWFLGWRRSASQQPQPKLSLETNSAVATQTSRANSPEDGSLIQNSEKSKNDSFNMSNSLDDASELVKAGVADPSPDSHSNSSQRQVQIVSEKYRKTLRLSSSQIESLNLKSGMNEIEFSVTTAYQGTSRCKCYLFKWRYDDKVVISDIDGTITRSDVLGHILPMVGKDWAQFGVAQLFSKIEQNGYKLLYLSARAIGQSRATREYLRSIRQGNVRLPDGPLLLNPTSLISAFHREVIERKPEQFKISCLSDIQALFPDKDKSPFYAGYGNRINDVWAYRAVGIPIHRIFTINTKGELKHELTQTFQSTYCSMAYIVDQLFPPLQNDEEAIEYSSFNYWRDPVLDISDTDLNLSGNTSGRTTPSNNNASQSLNKSLPTIPENIRV